MSIGDFERQSRFILPMIIRPLNGRLKYIDTYDTRGTGGLKDDVREDTVRASDV